MPLRRHSTAWARVLTAISSVGRRGQWKGERDRAPGFERHLLEQSPQQRIVRMAMRVDEARRHDQSARVEGLRRLSAAPRLVAQCDDNLALDKDVLRSRTMQLAFWDRAPSAPAIKIGPRWSQISRVGHRHFDHVSDLGLGSM